MHVRREGALVRATLSRPPVNALDSAAYRWLTGVCASMRPDECLLLDATGRVFSAGHDRGEPAAGEALATGVAALTAVLRCPAPVVVAAQGPAIGAGALLLAAADVPVIASDAWLQLPELDVGVTVGQAVLRRLLPPAMASRAFLTSEKIPAADITTAVVRPPEDLARAATDAAQAILRKSAALVSAARRGWGEREQTALAYEAELRACLAGP
ncbi:enoyl-CoA hydratase-related protein [Actinomadura sp. WMMA1423]|uniref:enoyl-CoA hydratase-related protein n=1 Tax=Actinomadura sp. WMMA1423 TaxID=2591108 RepID=UPI001146E99C|nr:enoyl-CoA hydratase-related protein [Actinomadura sp. WMMA1423]